MNQTGRGAGFPPGVTVVSQAISSPPSRRSTCLLHSNAIARLSHTGPAPVPVGQHRQLSEGGRRLGEDGRAQRREASRMAQETEAGNIAAGGLEAPIVGVTVFRDGARVTRAGKAEVPAGLGRVEVGALPASADQSSVRVAVRGAGVALLEVEVNRRFRTDPMREDTTRLRADLERLRDAVKELEDEDAAQEAGLIFLRHLSEAAAASLARAVR